MPIIINRKTGETNVPEITQEQRDYLWVELVRNYVRNHPEALSALNGFINRAVNAAMSGEQAAGAHAPAPLVTPERFVKISEHIKCTGETPEEFVDRAIEDTIARDTVSLSMGINPARK